MITVQAVVNLTRRYLNDETENVWTDVSIIDYINDAINDIKTTLPEYFTDLFEIETKLDTIVLESTFKTLLALFSASRCFFTDEQYYKEQTLRNEYENSKEMKINKVMESDAYYNKTLASGNTSTDYVRDVYSDNYNVGGE